MINLKERVGATPLPIYLGPERRRHVRLDDAFPAKVQGIDADGRPFDVETEVNNVSACGFHASLPVRVDRGAKLSTTIRFSTVSVAQARPKCLAVHGTVRRAEALPDGTFGVGVEFEHHLFL
jgi:hypothetical protein